MAKITNVKGKIKNLSIPLTEMEWAVFDNMRGEAEEQAGAPLPAAQFARFRIFGSRQFNEVLLSQYLEMIESLLPLLLDVMAEEEEE